MMAAASFSPTPGSSASSSAEARFRSTGLGRAGRRSRLKMASPEAICDIPPAAAGALRMLEEAGHQFDILDGESDFSRYKALILPDYIELC